MVVMLILGVLVTIGLSISSRSVTEVKVSTTQEESVRALEAAEIGLEKYLGGIAAVPKTLVTVDTGVQYSLSDTTSLGSGAIYKPPYTLADGEVATLDLTGYTGNGVRVCWGDNSMTLPNNEKPAMIASIYYQATDGTFQIKSRGYDPLSPVRYPEWRGVGGSGACGVPDITFAYSKLILFNGATFGLNISSGTPLFMRVRLVYNKNNSLPVAFNANGGASAAFPLQVGTVESIGTAGDSVQKIRAEVPDYDFPSVFDVAVYSGNGLAK